MAGNSLAINTHFIERKDSNENQDRYQGGPASNDNWRGWSWHYPLTVKVTI